MSTHASAFGALLAGEVSTQASADGACHFLVVWADWNFGHCGWLHTSRPSSVPAPEHVDVVPLLGDELSVQQGDHLRISFSVSASGSLGARVIPESASAKQK